MSAAMSAAMSTTMSTTATASAWVIFALIALLWGIVIVLSLDTHMGPDPDEDVPGEEGQS